LSVGNVRDLFMNTENESVVRRARRAADMSQVRFAQLIGANPSTICRWEVGKLATSPQVRALMLLIERDPKFCVSVLEQNAAAVRHGEGLEELLAAAAPLPELSGEEKGALWQLRIVASNNGNPILGRYFLKYSPLGVLPREELRQRLLSLEAKMRIALLGAAEAEVGMAEYERPINEKDRDRLPFADDPRGPRVAVRILEDPASARRQAIEKRADDRSRLALGGRAAGGDDAVDDPRARGAVEELGARGGVDGGGRELVEERFDLGELLGE
jgi:DNA-binding XRE family transcriptional regulator